MTRETLWAAYVARNPTFAGDDTITLSAAGLRKLFDQTWAQAEAHGRAAADTQSRFRDVFDEMFGAGASGGKGGAK